MLDNIQRVMNRMEQLENKLAQGPPVDSGAFEHILGRVSQPPVPQALATAGAQNLPHNVGLSNISGVNPQLWSMMGQQPGIDPSMFGMARTGSVNVQPLAQNNGISCGQTSVAMAVNALTGKNLRDYDINSRYGFELLNALNSESSSAGFRWRDGGEVGANSWELIDHKVNQEKTPVIVALNGPEFSPSGRGHIVTITKTEGDVVHFADPATGEMRTTTKQAMNAAPAHPDGNFIFYAVNEAQDGNHMASR